MSFKIPRVQVIPEADSQVSFQVEGFERLRYHSAARYARPFFYPVIGPAGRSLTRMGHPSAPDHDHHRSLWFAHHDVAGNNFWTEGQTPTIKQKRWIHYQDGEREAGMVVELGWYDGHDALLMDQLLIAVVRPLPDDELAIELQSTFSTKIDPLKLNKTNFGFLAVRVAKTISRYFGGGELRSANGGVGEREIFGKTARWVDYSGPIIADEWEGIAYLPHPNNVNHPSSWHVRDDGWMSAAFNLRDGFDLTPQAPLTLRYLLLVHSGRCERGLTDRRLAAFTDLPTYEVVRAERPWCVSLRRKGS